MLVVQQPTLLSKQEVLTTLLEESMTCADAQHALSVLADHGIKLVHLLIGLGFTSSGPSADRTHLLHRCLTKEVDDKPAMSQACAQALVRALLASGQDLIKHVPSEVLKHEKGLIEQAAAAQVADRNKHSAAQHISQPAIKRRKRKLAATAVAQPVAAPLCAPADPCQPVGLSDATLSGASHQLEGQVIDDGHDPLVLVGCVLEVPTW